MDVESKLIISILKLTRNAPVSTETLTKDAKIASSLTQSYLKRLQNRGLINLRSGIVDVGSLKRLKLAVHAIHLGADLQRVSSLLDWKEFENIAGFAFTRMGYSVNENFRFKHSRRMWEIDIVACRKPVALCVDCKRWRRGMYPSATKRIVEEQVARTSALAESLLRLVDKIECASWRRVKLVPAVLSLVTPRFRFYDNVPIVSVLQLRDFLSQLPAYVNSLRHFSMMNLAY